MISDRPFQICGSCHKAWNEWKDFILDPEVRLLGFQATTRLPDANLLVFEHRCGSSISLLARRLRHILMDGDQGQDLPSLFGSKTCNQYCRSIDNLKACDRPCINARDRKLILSILNYKEN